MRSSLVALSLALVAAATGAALAQDRGADAGRAVGPARRDAGRPPIDAAPSGADASAAASSSHAAHPDAGQRGHDGGDASLATGPAPTTFGLPMVQRGTGALTHYPVPEQLARMDVPVFVQVRSSAPLDHVSLFFRGQGAARYRELRMAPVGHDVDLPGGFGAQIPCEDTFPPAVEYYVRAVASSGVAVGTAGSATAPVRVPVVAQRTRPIVPTLPGRPPPRTCGSLAEAATAAQRDAGNGPEYGTADLGEPCAGNADCRRGLHCGSSRQCVFDRGR